MVAGIFSLVCCGPAQEDPMEKSTQPIKTEAEKKLEETLTKEEVERKTARASVKMVQQISSLGYHGNIYKIQIDSVEYILGTMRGDAPITVIDKRIIKDEQVSKN